MDPLAADYPYLTPYNYAGNKPIGDYDIDGMQSTGDPPLAAAGGGAGSTPVPASTSAPNSITAKTEVVPTQKPTIDVTKLPIREPDILQGPDDVGYWMSHDNYNPEMAHFVETKNAAAKATGADKALIWLGYGLQKTGEYGSVVKAVGSPQKVKAPALPFDFTSNAPAPRANGPKGQATQLVNGESPASTVTFYRGGSNLNPRKGIDYKVGADGFVTNRGVSINTEKLDPNIQKYGGAFELNTSSIPKTLTLKHTSGTHYEIQPVGKMTEVEFINAMKQVNLYMYNKIQ